MNIPQIALPTGALMPQLGFGTFKVDPQVTFDAVSSALELGYRHIDTAQMYRNEAEVGAAWTQSGVAREDLFITTKLDNSNHETAAARDSFERSLDALQTDYVDLFLIHWPLPTLYGGDLMMPWRVLEEIYQQGRARAIGLSNFQTHHLQVILDGAEVAPMVNQIEAHPYMSNNEVREFSRGHGLVTQAWSPLARGKAVSDPLLAVIGTEVSSGRASSAEISDTEDNGNEISAAQVALRWAIQRGDVIFPKSVTPQRQKQNLDLFSFELTDEQMRRINALDAGEAGRCGSHPDTMDRI